MSKIKLDLYQRFTSNGAGRRYFTKQTIANATPFLINRCFFAIRNIVFKKDIDIPVGIGTTLFWDDPFLYFVEFK